MSRGFAAAPLATVAAPDKMRDRRRHARVKITLLGRYMLADRREFPCQTIDMSPGGVLLFAPVKPEVGERVVVYLDQLGRIEGVVSRQTDNGFAIAINVPMLKRDKLADQLTWLANRHILGLPEDRRHERITPRETSVTVRTADGTEYIGRLIDISLSGAGVVVDLKAPIGAIVTLGRTQGRVVRLFDSGVAIEFLRLLPPETFDENIVL